jgi:hypothetical protein
VENKEFIRKNIDIQVKSRFRRLRGINTLFSLVMLPLTAFHTSRAAFQRSSAWQRATTVVRSMASLSDIIKKDLDDIKAAGTYKAERVITTPQAAHIKVTTGSGEVLNFW